MGAYENRAWIGHYAPWTDPNPDTGTETLVSLFNQAVATQPNSTATWFMGKTLTYGQLNEQVGRAAAALTKLGVGPGDRVAVALPNCPQHVVAVTAILRLGAAGECFCEQHGVPFVPVPVPTLTGRGPRARPPAPR